MCYPVGKQVPGKFVNRLRALYAHTHCCGRVNLVVDEVMKDALGGTQDVLVETANGEMLCDQYYVGHLVWLLESAEDAQSVQARLTKGMPAKIVLAYLLCRKTIRWTDKLIRND